MIEKNLYASFLICTFLQGLNLSKLILIFIFSTPKKFLLIGVYGYGAKTTTPENRSMTLARYDGFELIARVTGALVSPIIANNIDRYANFGLKLACDLFAVLYLILIITDTPRIIESNQKREPSIGQKIKSVVISPLMDMFKAIFKIRPKGLHVLIAIQFCMYATYCFVLEEKALKYLYLSKLFEGFTATDYSRFYAYATSINAVGLLVILPVLSKLFHLHDSLLLTICVGTEAGGNDCYNCKNVKIFWQIYRQLLIVIPDVLDNVN